MIPTSLYAYAGIALLAGAAVVYHTGVVSSMKVKVVQAQLETADAHGQLNARITAEADAVATAVSAALKTERAQRADQQEQYDKLKETAAADAAALVSARNRLRLAAASSSSRGPGGGDVSQAASSASRVQEAVAGGLSAADRNLIDGLLQVAADANADARAFNFVSQQYQVNCVR